jgi:hypothetical protein
MALKQQNQKVDFLIKMAAAFLIFLCCSFTPKATAAAGFDDIAAGIFDSFRAVSRQFSEAAGAVQSEIVPVFFKTADLASIFGGIKCYFGFGCAGKQNAAEPQESGGAAQPVAESFLRVSELQPALAPESKNQPSSSEVGPMAAVREYASPIVQAIQPVKEIQTIRTVTNNTVTVIVDESTKAKVEQLLRQLDSDRPNFSVGQSFAMPAAVGGTSINVAGGLFTVDGSGNARAQNLAASGSLAVQGNFTVSGTQTYSGAGEFTASTTAAALTALQNGGGLALRADNIALKGSTVSTADGGSVKFFDTGNHIDSAGNLVLAGGISAASLNAGAGAIQTTGAISGATVNGLALASLATGFSVAGGTASTTLTMDADGMASNWNTAFGWGDHSLGGYLKADGSITGATSAAQAFTGGVKTGKIYPASDSIAALQFNKADGTTNVLDIDTANGRVGIGTAEPEFKLTLDKGAGSPDGGILSIGTYGAGTDLATSGAGMRMIWYPKKGAFRAGYVDNSQWDDANIGYFSIATGYDSKANGMFSMAMGTGVTASGSYSTALGGSTTASGLYSTAMGGSTTASGKYSASLGYSAIAGGDYSFAIGNGITATSTNSLALGQYVTASAANAVVLGQGVGSGTRLENSVAGSLAVGFNSTIPTLFVGPSSGTGTTGNVGIGTAAPATRLDVAGSGRFITSYPQIAMNDTNATVTAGGLIRFAGNGGIYTYQINTAAAGDFSSAINAYTINSTGNVGIGTTDPVSRLHITSTATSPITAQKGNGFLYMGITGSVSNGLWFQGESATDMFFGHKEGTDDLVISKAGASSSELVRFMSSGNVGIGTTSPGQNLAVVGVYSAPSLNFDSSAIASFGSLSATKLAISSSADSPYAVSLQVKNSTVNGVAYPLVLNPLGGNVGIGTTAPGTLLDVRKDVAGALGPTFTLENRGSGVGSMANFDTVLGTGGYIVTRIGSIRTDRVIAGDSDLSFSVYSNGALSERMRIQDSGNVGIGTTSPSYQLQLSTDSAAKPGTNAWTVASDARLKTDITPFTDGLSILAKINPVNYTYNGKGGMPAGLKGIGIVAQDMMQAAPYTVSTYRAKLDPNDQSDTDIYNFNSSALTFVMINAIKEQQKEIDGLKLVLNPAGAISNASSTLATADGSGPFAWLANGLNALGLALKDGAASLREVAADKMTAKQRFCIDDVCVSRDEFKQLLEKNNIGNSVSPAPAPVTSAEPILDAVEGETDADAGTSGKAPITENPMPVEMPLAEEVTQEEASQIVEQIAVEISPAVEEFPAAEPVSESSVAPVKVVPAE